MIETIFRCSINHGYVLIVAPWKSSPKFTWRYWSAFDTGKPLQTMKDMLSGGLSRKINFTQTRHSFMTMYSCDKYVAKNTRSNIKQVITRNNNSSRYLLKWGFCLHMISIFIYYSCIYVCIVCYSIKLYFSAMLFIENEGYRKKFIHRNTVLQ